jgi:hypothetical protein
MKSINISLNWEEAVLLAHTILQIEDTGMFCRTVNANKSGAGINVEFCGLKGCEVE